MVPKNRFELPTFRLQGDCTTVVLHRHIWLRGLDLNQRPLGYEPNKLPGCSTPRYRIIWLRERELNPPVRLMRPESNHCFIPRCLERYVGLEPTLFLLGGQMPYQLGEYRICVTTQSMRGQRLCLYKRLCASCAILPFFAHIV